MIEAYKIGVSLVLDDTKLIGPLAEVLKAMERVQQAAQETQKSLAGIRTGLRAATAGAEKFAAASERAAAAWAKVQERVARAAAASRSARAPGGPAAPGGASPGQAIVPAPLLLTGPGAASGAPGGRAIVPAPLLLTGPEAASGAPGGRAIVRAPLLLTGPDAASSGRPPAVNLGTSLSVPGAGGFGGSGGGSAPPGFDLNMRPRFPVGNLGAGLDLMYRGLNAIEVIDMVVGGIGRLIDSAKGLNDQLVVLQQRGMSSKDADSIEDEAFRIARVTPGRSLADIVADAGNLRAVLGEKLGSADPMADVRTALPVLERLASALSVEAGVERPDALHMLLRAVELRGGLIDPATGHISTPHFETELGAIYKVLVSGGGMIKPNDLLNLMQQAGPMARMMDADSFYKMMMTAVLDMKGNRAGTALTAAGRQIFGGRMSKMLAQEMANLGLIPQGSFKAYGGGYVMLDKAASDRLIKGMDGNGGLFGWTQHVLRPALEAHGFKTNEQQNQELYRLFSTETARRLFALFLQNADQVLRDQHLLPTVLPPDKTIDLAKAKDIGYNMDALTTAFSNLFQVMEKANSGAIIGTLHAIQAVVDFLATGAQAEMKSDQNFQQKGGWTGMLWGPQSIWHGGLHGFLWGNKTAPAEGGDVHKESYAPGSSGANPIHLISYTTLDGRVIAKTVSNYQARFLSGPQAGTSGYDMRATPLSAGQQVAI